MKGLHKMSSKLSIDGELLCINGSNIGGPTGAGSYIIGEDQTP